MYRFVLLSRAIIAAIAAALVIALTGMPAIAATAFTTSTTWQWAYTTVATTANTTQTVEASLTGATDANKNGGLVLRRASSSQFLIANFSGTKYQLLLVNAGAMSVAYEKTFARATSGVARAEVSGTTVKAFWNGVAVSTNTVAALSTFPGLGTGLAIWQDRAYAVGLSAATATSPTAPRPRRPRPPDGHPDHCQPHGADRHRQPAGDGH
jgi:hypothetical protein